MWGSKARQWNQSAHHLEVRKSSLAAASFHEMGYDIPYNHLEKSFMGLILGILIA